MSRLNLLHFLWVLVVQCAITAVFSLSPVQAQSTATYGSSKDRVELIVPVTASVAGRCGFSSLPATVVELGDLEQGFSRDIPFVLSCNGPMRMAVQSQNGALVAPVAPAGGYTNRLDYTVMLHLVGTGGTSVVASCQASALQASSTTACDLRGTASTSVGLRLPKASNREQGSYVQVSAPPTSGLLASNAYTDVLVLTLSPAT